MRWSTVFFGAISGFAAFLCKPEVCSAASMLPRKPVALAAAELGGRQHKGRNKALNPVAIDRAGAKASPTSAQTAPFSLKNYLFGKDKLPWFICTVLSVIYFMMFEKKVPTALLKDVQMHSSKEYYCDGFCVSGLQNGETDPTCSWQAGNSHQFAWGIDFLYTAVALALPFTGLCKTPNGPKLLGVTAAIALTIFGHGYLHKLISHDFCTSAGSAGLVFYITFVLALTFFDLIGFSSIPAKRGLLATAFWSAVITGLIVLSTDSKTSPSMTGFFMIIQLVVSATGLLFPNPKTVTPQTGWAFIGPIIASLFEYADCNFLVQYGGHGWYDFFLHLSMLVTLLFGDFS